MNKKHIPMAELYPVMAEKIASGGEVTFRVMGGSMQPMVYHHRDTVTIKRHSGKLKKYDLPFYRRDDGTFILHRVIKLQKDGNYTCRGDNQWEKEYNVRDDQIIGIVTAFERNRKKIDVSTSKGYKFYCKIWPWVHFLKPFYKYFVKFKSIFSKK
ncbi:MAG: S24/S26 family peptidase [Clostridia bacterium]|nr:S24/S26 family peptidase [Clostridia bacterium]